MAALFLIMTLLGCVLLYLSHPNQRWLARPLPVIGGRWSGLVLVITGLLVAISYLPVNAALFAWLAWQNWWRASIAAPGSIAASEERLSCLPRACSAASMSFSHFRRRRLLSVSSLRLRSATALANSSGSASELESIMLCCLNGLWRCFGWL